MTNKLKLFKVRLESGVTRSVVAPSGADVWALRFEGPPDAAVVHDDEIKGVEEVGLVDCVLLREPAQPKMFRAENPCAEHDVSLVGTACVKCGWMILQSEFHAERSHSSNPPQYGEGLSNANAEKLARERLVTNPRCPRCGRWLIKDGNGGTVPCICEQAEYRGTVLAE